jgi:hypothetical protein
MTFEAASDLLLEWLVRAAGLFWAVGALMLFRQIQTEMALDNMTAKLERQTQELARELDAEPKQPDPVAAWLDRDDRLRRGWIAAQAVILAATALAMLMLHPFAVWMAAVLVLGQGVYFLWRESIARRAPTPDAAAHARPSPSTVNAGWFSLGVAVIVWLAAFRGLLR